MTQQRRLLHRSATVWPVRIEDYGDLTSLARWFADLRSANSTTLAFDRQTFDRAIARQWLTVCQGARRGGVPIRQVGIGFQSGMRMIGVGLDSMTQAIVEAARDRA